MCMREEKERKREREREKESEREIKGGGGGRVATREKHLDKSKKTDNEQYKMGVRVRE